MYLSGLTFNLPKSESESKLEFSFATAYKYFMEAAEKGHTLAAYNLAVMHHIGLGTYQSCSLAMTFIQHVALVGPHA
jgi:TPR repeat protein